VTEQAPGYVATEHEPYREWVECSVLLPSEDGSSKNEVHCKAKLRCDDVIDALDLDRWSAIAFQHLWRSGRQSTRRRHLSSCLWYLKRAIGEHSAEARSVARLLRALLQRSVDTNMDLRTVILCFMRDAEAAEFSALDLVHRCAQQEKP